MQTNKISLIVPCYWANQGLIDMTERCLVGLTGYDELIVVDDGSPLAHRPKCDIFISLNQNGGFATAVNAGIGAAIGDVLVIVNNDIEFIQPEWLEHLLAPFELGYHVSSIRTTDSDGWETEDKITENDKFGSCWAMKREVFQKVGYLDDSFGKGLFEDLDYWRRVRDAGFRIAKNHAGLVEHHGKQTFKEVDPTDELFGKNMFIYKQKWGDKAHIIETEPNAILLIDEYELANYTPMERKEMKKHGVSLAEAETRWNVKLETT